MLDEQVFLIPYFCFTFVDGTVRVRDTDWKEVGAFNMNANVHSLEITCELLGANFHVCNDVMKSFH
jgi:hypothetical protein